MGFENIQLRTDSLDDSYGQEGNLRDSMGVQSPRFRPRVIRKCNCNCTYRKCILITFLIIVGILIVSLLLFEFGLFLFN